MTQSSATIYGDLVSAETLNEMKRKMATQLYAMSMITNLTNRVQTGINTLQIPDITTSAAQSKAIGTDFDAPSGESYSSKTLTMSLKAGNPFYVEHDYGAQTPVNIYKEKAAAAAGNILLAMDALVLAGMIGAVENAANVDFAGAASVVDTISKLDFTNARKYITGKGAPLDGRFCLIDQDHEAQLYSIPDFISADKIAKTAKTPITDGFIGRLSGFDIVLLSHIPQVDKAGAINATAAKNDSYPVIFGQSIAYCWAKQFVETMSSVAPLSVSDLFVPYNIWGHKDLEASYLYMVSDETTADPT